MVGVALGFVAQAADVGWRFSIGVKGVFGVVAVVLASATIVNGKIIWTAYFERFVKYDTDLARMRIS